MLCPPASGEERFSSKEVQFKHFCSSINTSWPPEEDSNETPGFIHVDQIIKFSGYHVILALRTKKINYESLPGKTLEYLVKY